MIDDAKGGPGCAQASKQGRWGGEFFRRSLRWQLLLSGLLAWAVAALLFGLGMLYLYDRALEEKTLFLMQAVSNAHAVQLRDIAGAMAGQMEALTNTPDVQALLLKHGEITEVSGLQNRIAYPGATVEQMTAIPKASAADPLLKRPASDAPRLPDVVTRISEWHANGPVRFQVLAPVRHESTEPVLGWLSLHVRLDGLDQVLRHQTQLGRTAETYLVSSEGRALSPLRFWADTADTLVDTWVLGAARQGLADSFGRYPSYHGESVLGAAAPVPELDAYVVTEMRAVEALGPVRKLALVGLGLWGVTALLGCLAALGLGSLLLRPLVSLRQTAVAMAGGRFDLRVPVDRDDELGELGAAFNRMAEVAATSLTAEREFNQRVVASIPSGILVVSAGLEVRYANKALRRMLPHEGALPATPLLVIPAWREYITQVLTTREPLRDVELTVPHSHGPRHYRATVAGFRRAEEEEEEEVVVVIDDVTGQKREAVLKTLHHEVDRRLLSQEPQVLVLQSVCDTLVSLYGCVLGWFGVKDPDGSIRVVVQGRPEAEQNGGMPIDMNGPVAESGVAARALSTRQPRTEDGAAGSLQADGVGSDLSSVALPVAAQGQNLGVLVLHARRHRALEEHELAQLIAFTDAIALSLLSAQRLEQIRLQTTALESAANAIVITDAQGVIQWVNPALTQLTGYPAKEVIGQTPRIFKSGKYGEAFYRKLWSTILAGQVWQGPIINRRKDGTLYTEEQVITPVKGADGTVSHFITIKVDVTERKRQEERIHHLATHDPLTELPNRRVLVENLKRAVARARRGRQGALLFLDLSNFKLVNDTAGHSVGDRLLIAAGEVISGALRQGDLLARLGGDEFAVLLEDTSPEEARAIAERILRKMQEFSWPWGEHRFDLAASIGIAVIDGREETESVLTQADTAMYEAKAQGGNRCLLYLQQERLVAAATEVAWLARIKNALRLDAFELHFQPVVSLSDGELVHVEALIRMRDEQGALELPDQFIPRAERFGVMPQIDRWVLQRALVVLRTHPDLRVFVNLSGPTLADEDIVKSVEMLLRDNKVAPGRLGFEITETSAVLDIRRAQRVMHELKGLGCLFALDDFGMGFSSFSYLRTLPADYVKLDGSFTQHLDSDPVNSALVEAMSNVAHALDKKVIAEKVEREEDAILLRRAGVDYGQGYLWGKASGDVALLAGRHK